MDAWEYLKNLILCDHYKQHVEKGSFEGEETFRRQAEPLLVEIEEPSNFLTYPRTVTFGMVEGYYNGYLLSPDHPDGEDYSYGERIFPQITPVFEMLRKTPNTNQAIILIARPDDVYLKYPPCLREIQFLYFRNRLHLFSFWRSNDIGEAFLINQGGLALFLVDAAQYAGLDPGSHYYCSSAPHLYSNYMGV